MSNRVRLAVVLLSTIACGCTSLDTETEPNRIVGKGPISGYVTLDALEAEPGGVVSGGLLTDTEREGELISFDLWPVFGFGAGLSGARLRTLMLEFAFGTWLLPPEQPEPTVDAEVEEIIAGDDS